MRNQRKVGYRWLYTFDCDNCGARAETYDQLSRAGFSQFASGFPEAAAAGVVLPEHLCPDCAKAAIEGALRAIAGRAREVPKVTLQAPPRQPPRTGPKSLDEPGPSGPTGPRT